MLGSSPTFDHQYNRFLILLPQTLCRRSRGPKGVVSQALKLSRPAGCATTSSNVSRRRLPTSPPKRYNNLTRHLLDDPHILLASPSRPSSHDPAKLMSESSQRISPAVARPSQDMNLSSPQEKRKAGASWKAVEQHILPYNRLGIVVPGLMACIFLTALDQVSIPGTISSFQAN